MAFSEASCPVSGMAGGRCPAGHGATPSVSSGQRDMTRSRLGPRGCSFSGFSQPGDIHAAFDIPKGVDVEEWLRSRERTSINEILYTNMPTPNDLSKLKSQVAIDATNPHEQDVLALALGAPARQVMLRAQDVGPRIGWRDGHLSVEHGFCPPDYDESAGALARCPGRIWSDLCERMPGCVARGRVRVSVVALPVVEGMPDVVPDQALWAAIVALGMLCHIYRYEEKYDGQDGVIATARREFTPNCETGDRLGEELVGIPMSIALPYYQISRRMGRALPHLSFPDQSSCNLKIKDVTSAYPYLARFDNIELRWPMFGEQAEVAFLKGVADTSASFQHGPDAIAACQEAVMKRDVEGLLREMIRLKEILERMPNAFHSISTNPNSGENYVPAQQWVLWGKFSSPLSKRCPASSGLQFPPYLVMDAFLGRKKYDSFLGVEGVHLRAWLPSNLRAFIAAIEYHYRIPEFVAQSGDPRLMGVLDGIVEAYTGERGFMGAHRYKVFGILEVASKTGRTETNGASGAADLSKPWEESHRQFSEAMKERLAPYRGDLAVEPHQMRGTFEECRYVARISERVRVDTDPGRDLGLVRLDIRNTGITFQPGDRLAVMPFNSWTECAKVAAALGLEDLLDAPVPAASEGCWSRFARHLGTVRRAPTTPQLTVRDVLRRGHLAPITKELALKMHHLLRASSNTVLQVLATPEWPVRGSLGDLLQEAVVDTPATIWDKAFGLDDLSWLPELIPLEVPRTYSIASYTEELLPETVDLAVSRAEFDLSPILAKSTTARVRRAGVSSGFLNPQVMADDGDEDGEDEILVGLSRPVAFQLPIDLMAPCAFFAGGSGIAPFRSFWQARLATSGLSGGRNTLYLGVQSREKFCFEEELRSLGKAGFMEVHVAFSRDSRGLEWSRNNNDLVEKHIPPRRIDTLILEQGPAVCDMVMSKKQGGLGGYLYVCGSLGVFDCIMNSIRRALYTYRTADSDSVDLIVDKAFAERRFMLDVFMTPKPLPCNLPTIPASQLALRTGHRPGTDGPASRIWIGVHGSVYDVTDFCPMHPGGTLIIKSNAGVDCSQSFDNLAHTNNPEVKSLLTKYFIGHLSPRPDLGGGGSGEAAALYDLWASYLRTTVETLVAHQFEMHELMGASLDSSHAAGPRKHNIWLRESMPSIIAVREFYSYQSRLLQGGFAALFGPKMQELVLRLSFALASVNGPNADTKLPDVLGTVARAQASSDAAMCTMEVAKVGDFVCDVDANLRFQERGLFAYAAHSVEIDMALLEDLRGEACAGMDAFDVIARLGKEDRNGDGDGDEPDADADVEDDARRLAALSSFLLQILERMASHLAVFYAQLSRLAIYQPELERNPARARWALVRRRITDGSLFVLASKAELQLNSSAHSKARGGGNIRFDRVMEQVQASLRRETSASGLSLVLSASSASPAATSLNAVHQARGRSVEGTTSAVASRENAGALRAMGTFVEKNSRAIRRLSRLPAGVDFGSLKFEDLGLEDRLGIDAGGAGFGTTNQAPSGPPTPPSLDEYLHNHHHPLNHHQNPPRQQQQRLPPSYSLPTPPTSRSSSRSPPQLVAATGRPSAEAIMMSAKLHRRPKAPSTSFDLPSPPQMEYRSQGGSVSSPQTHTGGLHLINYPGTSNARHGRGPSLGGLVTTGLNTRRGRASASSSVAGGSPVVAMRPVRKESIPSPAMSVVSGSGGGGSATSGSAMARQPRMPGRAVYTLTDVRRQLSVSSMRSHPGELGRMPVV